MTVWKPWKQNGKVAEERENPCFGESQLCHVFSDCSIPDTLYSSEQLYCSLLIICMSIFLEKYRRA